VAFAGSLIFAAVRAFAERVDGPVPAAEGRNQNTAFLAAAEIATEIQRLCGNQAGAADSA
jgi:hypothetical protein